MTMKMVFAPQSSSKSASLVKYILFYSVFVTFGGALLALAIILIEDNLGYTPPPETGFLTNIIMCFVGAIFLLRSFQDTFHRLLSRSEYIQTILYSSLAVTALTMAIAAAYLQAVSPQDLDSITFPQIIVAMFVFSAMTQTIFVWASFSAVMRFLARKKVKKSAPKIKTAKAKMSSVLAADAKFVIPTKVVKAPKRKKAVRKARPKKVSAVAIKNEVQPKRKKAPTKKKAA